MTYEEKIKRLNEATTLDELADTLDEINGSSTGSHPYNHGDGLRSQVKDGECALIFVLIQRPDLESNKTYPITIEKFLVDAHGGINTEHAKAWWVFQRAANMFNSNSVDVDPAFEYTRLDPPDCLDSECYFETSWVDRGNFFISIESRAMKVKP